MSDAVRDALHAAKLYCSLIDLIGRRVEFTSDGRTCTSLIVACEVTEIELVMTLSLHAFSHHKVRALVFSIQEQAWSLHLENSNEKTIHAIRFSDS